MLTSSPLISRDRATGLVCEEFCGQQTDGRWISIVVLRSDVPHDQSCLGSFLRHAFSKEVTA